jgi:catalase
MGGGMAHLSTQLIDAFIKDFPGHKEGTRPVHTRGSLATGLFRGSFAAGKYCVAPHFQPSLTHVTVRFSNGNGSMDPDATRQVRGMAVKFHIGDAVRDEHLGRLRSDVETDLIAVNVSQFMTKTPEQLLDFLGAAVPRPVRQPSIIQRLKALLTLVPVIPVDPGVTASSDAGVAEFARHYPASAFVLANSLLAPPASYLRTAYHAVHAFDVEGSDGTHRWGRFSWEPAGGVRTHSPADTPTLSADYLAEDLIHRSEEYPSRFNLRMQLADPEDDPTDPTTAWPQNRRRILMGTLRLWAHRDQQAEAEKLSFNPGRLVKGIAMSDDPTLQARIDVYNTSQRLRGAESCPVTGSLG